MHQAGIACEILPAVGDEISRKGSPSGYVQDLAEHKAYEVYSRLMKESGDGSELLCCIGADTIVVHKGDILGKPADRKDAIRMIGSLQGEAHSVMTGVAVLYNDKEGTLHKGVFFEETYVDVFPMTEEEITSYVNSGECDDKAGAYGIQGPFGAYIREIRGDYTCVVGLPLGRTVWELKQLLKQEGEKA